MRFSVRMLLALLFIAAGTLHLLNPKLFRPIMPPWIPLPMACIIVSGLCEIAGGLGLMVPMKGVQIWAGWGLMALLVAVFPANIYMAVDKIRIHGFPSHSWMGWARLPLQPLIMWAVAWAAGLFRH
jgi:uncharacterized membrane protein